MFGRQRQRGGDDSVQVQAARDVVIVHGITEERAREIAATTARHAIDEYVAEGQTIAGERIDQLDVKVVERLLHRDRLDAFGDPSFQRALRKGQIGAAATNREADFDMLAELLSDRVDRLGDRRSTAGIDRAVEVVDQLDEVALRGLTIFHAVTQWHPASGMVLRGLDDFAELFGHLMDGELPTGSDWLEHLDILDAVRVSSITTLKPFDDFFAQSVLGYVAPGRPREISEEEAAEIDDVFIRGLVDHELREGYVRIPAVGLEELKSASSAMNAPAQTKLIEFATTSLGLGTIDPDAKARLIEEIQSRPQLSALRDFWTGIPAHFRPTSVGKALARANAQRLYTTGGLPPLD